MSLMMTYCDKEMKAFLLPLYDKALILTFYDK
jgi:hypothetical protein